MIIQLHQLSPYLPYGLKVKLEFMEDSNIPWYYEDKEVFTLEGMMLDWWHPNGNRDITKITPFLIPLDTLTPEMVHMDEISFHIFIERIKSGKAKYCNMVKLFEKHCDVFDLIGQGLAVDKNTLKPC